MNGELGKWELRAYSLVVVAAVGVFKFLFGRFFKRWNALQKIGHHDHVRLGQHEEDLVKHVRKGEPYPDLTKGDE